MIDRRRFLKHTTLGTALAGLSPALLMSRPSAASGSTRPLSAAAFAAQQGSWFELRGDERYYVQLLRVDEVPVDPALEQFRLGFRGPANEEVPEGLYEITSDAGDSHTLFVQPVGNDDEGNLYLAPVSVIGAAQPVPEPTVFTQVLAGLGLLIGLGARLRAREESN